MTQSLSNKKRHGGPMSTVALTLGAMSAVALTLGVPAFAGTTPYFAVMAPA